MNRKSRTVAASVAVAVIGVGGIATAYALPTTSSEAPAATGVTEAPAPVVETPAVDMATAEAQAAADAQAAAEAAFTAEVTANMQAQAAAAEAQAAADAQAAAEAAFTAEVTANMQAAAAAEAQAAATSDAAIAAAVAANMQAQAAAQAQAELAAAVAANMQAQAAAAPVVEAPSVSTGTSDVSGGATGDAASWASSAKAMSVKMCESGNNYSTNTGNGYYGAWQFDIPSWMANGGGAYASRPDLAPAWAQDQVAYNYWSVAGWGPWSCG